MTFGSPRLPWLVALAVAGFMAATPATAQERPEGALADEPGLAGEPPPADLGHGEHATSFWDVWALDNYELWGPVVNFLLFLFLIVFFGGPRIRQALQSRRAKIEQDLTEARELRAAAQATYDEYTSRLQQLDQEMAKIRQEMIRAGEAERDRIVAEAEGKASRMRRETQFVIDQQLKQLRKDLTREAVEAAVTTAEKVLTEKITPADQQRLAKEYLGSLQNDSASPSDARGGSRSPGATAVAKGGNA
jgi:F-type H+-transporting ATPase subunit b